MAEPKRTMEVRVTGGLARDMALRAEAFYNKSHQQSGADGGQFVEGPDGPGRKRDPGTEDLGKDGTNQPAKKEADSSMEESEKKPGRTTVSVGLRGNAKSSARKAFLEEKGLKEGTPEYDKALSDPKGTRISVAKKPTEDQPAKVEEAKPAMEKPDPKAEPKKASEPEVAPSKAVEPALEEKPANAGMERKLTSKEETRASRNFLEEYGRYPKSREEMLAYGQKPQETITKTVDGIRQIEPSQPQHKRSGQLLADLTEKEMVAVEDYVSSSGKTNDALRDGEKPSAKTKAIDGLMARSMVTETITAYRGVNAGFSEELADMPVGGSYTDKGYTSTTTVKSAADSFGSKSDDDPGVTFTFIVPKGTHAVAMGGGEAELLVERGATWVKTSKKEFTLQEA